VRNWLVLSRSLLALANKSTKRIAAQGLVVASYPPKEAPVCGRYDSIAHLGNSDHRQLLPVYGKRTRLYIDPRLVSGTGNPVESLLVQRTAYDRRLRR